MITFGPFGGKEDALGEISYWKGFASSKPAVPGRAPAGADPVLIGDAASERRFLNRDRRTDKPGRLRRR